MARVLVADDDPINLRVVARFLSSLGHEVTCAEDGLKALALARQELPELVILDIVMPGLDGLAVLEKLRREVAMQDTPIIMLTSNDNDADRETAQRLGASDYLVKPFNRTVMAERVEHFVGPG